MGGRGATSSNKKSSFESMAKDMEKQGLGNITQGNGITRVELKTLTSFENNNLFSERVRENITNDFQSTTQEELNKMPVYLTIYGKSGNVYKYMYKNTKELLTDVKKSYGGFKELVGTGKSKSIYTIEPATKIGEYYYKRDKLAKGGYAWKDANDVDVKGYQNKSGQSFEQKMKGYNTRQRKKDLKTYGKSYVERMEKLGAYR